MFKKGQRNQRSNCTHQLDHQKSKRVPVKHLLLLFWLRQKAFDCVDRNKLWKILQKMGIPDHLTCLLRNLYAGQEATVRTRYGKTDWFQIGKGVCQDRVLSACLFNLHAEYIMRNAGLARKKHPQRFGRWKEGEWMVADRANWMRLRPILLVWWEAVGRAEWYSLITPQKPET